MGNVQSIPATKVEHVSPEEKAEFDAYRNGEDNLYEPGITDVPNAYDPEAGSKYAKQQRAATTATPTFATDEGQPKNVGSAKVITRQKAVDKSDHTVLDSGKGRKSATSPTNQE